VPHACADAGIAREALACVEVGWLQLDEGVCGASTEGNLVREGRGLLRTPEWGVTGSG
jgi:hypothetical protein